MHIFLGVFCNIFSNSFCEIPFLVVCFLFLFLFRCYFARFLFNALLTFFGMFRVRFFSYDDQFFVAHLPLRSIDQSPHAVVVSPDAGGVYRAKKFREGLAYRYGLDAGLAMIIKQRAKANEASGVAGEGGCVWGGGAGCCCCCCRCCCCCCCCCFCFSISITRNNNAAIAYPAAHIRWTAWTLSVVWRIRM